MFNEEDRQALRELFPYVAEHPYIVMQVIAIVTIALLVYVLYKKK